MERQKLSRSNDEDNDPHWTGWTRSLEHIPLKEIQKDGYDVKEIEDERGKIYWQIIKVYGDKHL